MKQKESTESDCNIDSFPPDLISTEFFLKLELHPIFKKLWPHKDFSNVQLTPQKLIVEIFHEYIRKFNYDSRLQSLLEYSRYLENFLWPHFDKDAPDELFLSIVLVINQKIREGVCPWSTVTGIVTADGELFEGTSDPVCRQKFSFLFFKTLGILSQRNAYLCPHDKIALVVFFINCFKSLENEVVRLNVLPSVSLGIWDNLPPSKLEKELSCSKKLKTAWGKLQSRLQLLSEEEREQRKRAGRFLYEIIDELFLIFDKYDLSLADVSAEKVSELEIQLAERIVELLVDLQSQLPTRRYTHLVIDYKHVVVKCMRSKFSAALSKDSVFNRLVELLRFYMGFEINNITGAALTETEMEALHYGAIKELQRLAFTDFPELEELAMASVSSIDSKEKLLVHLKPLSDERLLELAQRLYLVPAATSVDRNLLCDVITEKYVRRMSQIDAINRTPLFPSEDTLFYSNIPDKYFGDICLALPKLNLQFLTLHDYLLRNLNLFMLESFYEIREDIIDVIKRMPAYTDGEGRTHFGGWARMAVQMDTFSIVEVAKPNLGEFKPSKVRADISFDTSLLRANIKTEWDNLRRHDVLFLVAIQGSPHRIGKPDPKHPFLPQRYGVQYVRGCEVEGYLDNDGSLYDDAYEKPKQFKGPIRTLRVWLDTNQYFQDINGNKQDAYDHLNLIIRRKPKENNFKAVLATIKDLMNTHCVVPDWLHDVFLGYGAPDSAAYWTLVDFKKSHTYNFNDTFVDLEHLRASFPRQQIEFDSSDPSEFITPPFKITFPARSQPLLKEGDILVVKPYKHVNMGPYPQNVPRTNVIRFTPVQVEAIVSAMYPGLTMVVGPPGTGKTDVAVQIISNWYHNNPEQRTLLITHSNQTLNQLFEKIIYLDIDERHLLRLGMGEKDIDSKKVFTKYGRVNYILERRLLLLDEVQRLAESFGVQGDIGYTCETAGYFYLYSVLAKWEEFLSKIRHTAEDAELVSKAFPFHKYFASAPQPLFKKKSLREDFEIAEGCFRHLKKIFTELEEFKAFEILRTGSDRVDYLLVKEAKIIAMTCTHAALKRADLVKLRFQFDNVLLEEAGQILEIETFIPLMCQNPEDGRNRLKRVVLIGDHHQLPPIIKNQVFQKFCNMEQSMFSRFIRLNVPAVHLNAQGRARPSIATLFRWRYRDLGDLDHVHLGDQFKTANAGFLYEYQFIDVQDLNGAGETHPQPYFYQNLAEAEYVVWTFMYMRLLGYPAKDISIITSYNGQKHLIRDVLNSRCAWNPLFGLPYKVTTVDRYQGQQNDYILLSLVRTRNIGHIRDVRRLVVSLSRARLGLYVFGRESLFSSCFEFREPLRLFKERPTKLVMVPFEIFPTNRQVDDIIPPNHCRSINDVIEMAKVISELQKQYETQANNDNK